MTNAQRLALENAFVDYGTSKGLLAASDDLRVRELARAAVNAAFDRFVDALDALEEEKEDGAS